VTTYTAPMRDMTFAAEPKDGGRLLLTTENTIEIQGEAKPALIAIARFMIVEP
jgi:hypothetical protein